MNTVHIRDSKLIRDIHSKAVLNTDRAALNSYYDKREIVKKQCEEQTDTKRKLIRLEEEMQEIKLLLIEIDDLRKK